MNTPFEKRICYTICICQLTMVLSCVSIVYLTVAVYTPAYRTLNSGFSEDPVMCTTIKNETVVNCENPPGTPSWSSCGEWCLSKSSGSCTQITVAVRRNGSNIRLEECEPSEIEVKYCDGINPKMKVYECIKGDCVELTGIFNCTKAATTATGETPGAMCRNLTSVLSCILTTTENEITCNTKKSCMDLDGLHTCKYGKCARVRPPYKCEKRCISISTGQKSVMIRQGDVIYTANCRRAVDAETGTEIWPKDKTSLSNPGKPPMLVIFCTDVFENSADKTMNLMDCFNGTLLEPDHFGNYTNITYILTSHLESTEAGDRMVDMQRVYAPPEQDLLIKNSTPLYINFEGCVNTLILNECEKFHADYGGDGTDLRSQSRFRCFYTPNDTQDFVVLRFSRAKTILELLIASSVPITLAVISCFTLVLCTRIIHVGDDSHFSFQCCGSDAQAALEKEAVEAMAL